MCFIYQQSLKSRSQLYVPSLRHYETAFCFTYYHLKHTKATFSVRYGLIFMYVLYKRQMLRGRETSLGGPVDNINPSPYLQMQFKLSALSNLEAKQSS
jgi:hypothetical protein